MRVQMWVVCGPNMTNQYRQRYQFETTGEGAPGPIDDRTYELLSTVVDITGSQGQYKTKSVNGNNPFTNYAMNFTDEQEAADAMAFLNVEWPGQQFEIEGGWYWDTGLEIGVTAEGGDPVYPLSPTAYELMPDIVEYDEDGNEISRTPATSNADLRNVNRPMDMTKSDYSASASAALFFELLDIYGTELQAARIRAIEDIPAGTSIRAFLTVRDNGDIAVRRFNLVTASDTQKEDAATELAAQIDASPIFDATTAGSSGIVRITCLPGLTFTVAVYVN